MFTGRAAIAERLRLLHRSRITTHFVGNHLATVDGDRGTGETYCLAYHVDGPPDRNHLDWTSTSLLDAGPWYG